MLILEDNLTKEAQINKQIHEKSNQINSKNSNNEVNENENSNFPNKFSGQNLLEATNKRILLDAANDFDNEYESNEESDNDINNID
jgi:hypothetical protein